MLRNGRVYSLASPYPSPLLLLHHREAYLSRLHSTSNEEGKGWRKRLVGIMSLALVDASSNVASIPFHGGLFLFILAVELLLLL